MCNPTLLIVDDEPANLALLTELLRTDYEVRAANSGEAALRACGAPPYPDLILLDVMMPGLSGYEMLSQLRSNTPTASVPVIFVTALGDSVEEEYGLQLGAVDYVVKPIQPAILLARIRTHLELKTARDRLKEENRWLETEVHRRTEEILVIQDVGINALADLAETRDPETGNHIHRTQEYVGLLAETLRAHPRFREVLTDHYIALVTKSAPLHDIGKVGIPDAILLKPGRLTPEEMAIMRTHTVLGEAALAKAMRIAGRPVEFLALAKEIARSHHERWDGGGYPDGLAGESIPVSARMMALADVYDALVTPRVYKQALGHEEARSIIEQGKGAHFDPDMVEAFLGRFDDFVAVGERLRDAETAS